MYSSVYIGLYGELQRVSCYWRRMNFDVFRQRQITIYNCSLFRTVSNDTYSFNCIKPFLSGLWHLPVSDLTASSGVANVKVILHELKQ